MPSSCTGKAPRRHTFEKIEFERGYPLTASLRKSVTYMHIRPILSYNQFYYNFVLDMIAAGK